MLLLLAQKSPLAPLLQSGELRKSPGLVAELRKTVTLVPER